MKDDKTYDGGHIGQVRDSVKAFLEGNPTLLAKIEKQVKEELSKAAVAPKMIDRRLKLLYLIHHLLRHCSASVFDRESLL